MNEIKSYPSKIEEFNPVDGRYFLITKDRKLLGKAWDIESARIIADAFDQWNQRYIQLDWEREPETPYYDIIGNEVEFLLDGVWHDATVINEYRTHDGSINVRLHDGRIVWCPVARHSEYVREKQPLKEGQE